MVIAGLVWVVVSAHLLRVTARLLLHEVSDGMGVELSQPNEV